ncbi:MAG: patatin-like phospholipase family protein [Acidobacteria bacterium]|nr:patatin-like phospholipase family protein [Acidobacteriota bacterium]
MWREMLTKASRRVLHLPSRREPAIGLALGGGFARGVAHVGVLRALERHGIPVRFIGGVSAGSIVAAAYASGCTPDELETAAGSMKFRDVARWTVSKMGLADSERMEPFLTKLLKSHRFEEMRIPLAVVASDLITSSPAVFRGAGDVMLAVRASCSYPGMFIPIEHEGRVLVDGAMTMELPAEPLRRMGATHVISVCLPTEGRREAPTSVFGVVNRCFQIMQKRLEGEWRRHSNLVLAPSVAGTGWDGFQDAKSLIAAGEQAATEALPRIRAWLGEPALAVAGLPKAS